MTDRLAHELVAANPQRIFYKDSKSTGGKYGIFFTEYQDILDALANIMQDHSEEGAAIRDEVANGLRGITQTQGTDFRKLIYWV